MIQSVIFTKFITTKLQNRLGGTEITLLSTQVPSYKNSEIKTKHNIKGGVNLDAILLERNVMLALKCYIDIYTDILYLYTFTTFFPNSNNLYYMKTN